MRYLFTAAIAILAGIVAYFLGVLFDQWYFMRFAQGWTFSGSFGTVAMYLVTFWPPRLVAGLVGGILVAILTPGRQALITAVGAGVCMTALHFHFTQNLWQRPPTTVELVSTYSVPLAYVVGSVIGAVAVRLARVTLTMRSIRRS